MKPVAALPGKHHRQGNGRRHHTTAADEILRKSPEQHSPDQRSGGGLGAIVDDLGQHGGGVHRDPTHGEDHQANNNEDLVEAFEQFKRFITGRQVLARATTAVRQRCEGNRLCLGQQPGADSRPEIVARDHLEMLSTVRLPLV